LKKSIGEITFIPTNEILIYTDREKFTSDLRDMVDCVDPNGVRAKVYNQNDLDLRYEMYAIIEGEYGSCMPKSQFLILKIAPSFNLTEKLEVIHRYENTHSSKNTITRYDGYRIIIADRIDESMPVKKIKNLVDRRCEKAMKSYKKANSHNMHLPPKTKTEHSFER